MTTDAPPDMSQAIAAFKQGLADRRAVLKRPFAEIEQHIQREAEAIQAEAAAGGAVVPELDYRWIREGTVPPAIEAAIRRRGCAVVHGVFPAGQIAEWDAELGTYLADNHYAEREKQKRGLDQYFSTLAASRPQIFGIYWSKPQVLARQDPKLAETRAWLNGLWRVDRTGPEAIDPTRECTYADRIRRREPGDRTLGLSPHMDGGSVERWLDPGFQKVYAAVFAGDWSGFDPFDARHRLTTREVRGAAVGTVFRTWQGWTALTAQGPRDGTLQLIPVVRGIAYMLLRALMDDVPTDDLCGARPARALSALPAWHAPLLAALVPVPQVAPGDTVWWHCDVVHGVADEHAGTGFASVMYIGAVPDCAKNRAFLVRQKAAFLAGRSAPDFAPEDYEVDFVGRATAADLTPLGRQQMGF